MEKNIENIANLGNDKLVSHLKINTDEVNEFIEDKSILEIIDIVKQSYPFTFIGRQKFRRKIDQLDFGFWIKDANEKMIIVNEVFAKSLNQKTSEIEGKILADLYDYNEYLLVKSVTNYIVSTSNSVIYESFSKKSNEDLVQVVEFPICDIDDKVVAIIGFKQKSFKLETLINEEPSASSLNIEEIPAVFVLVANNFVVKSFSNKFSREFNLNPQSIVNQNLQSIFNIDFNKLMQKDSGTTIKIGKSEYVFEYKKSVINAEECYYFSFIQILEKNSKTASSEKMFDLIMYTSPDPMFIYSVDSLKFLKVNKAALDFYGYREDEFLGMDLTDLYAPEDIQTLVDSSSHNTLERGYSGPWRQKKKDGSSIEVEVSKSGIEFNGNRAHFNIIHDISKNLQNDKVVNQLNLFVENTSDIIIKTDSDGFVKEVNNAINEKFGYDKKSVLERPFLSFVADEFRAKINTSIFHASSFKRNELECDFKKEDGSLVKVKLISIPTIGSNKEVESFLIIVKSEKDVIIKTVVQKEIINEVSTSKVSGNLDSEFLGHLFHELLTPVNVIIGFSQELAENGDSSNDETKEAIDIIRQNQRILLQLMDNAVQYSELEQNKMKINPTNVHFVELIDQIENDTKKVISNYNKEFSYGKISSSLVFETDKTKIEVLATMLVDFAIRASKNEKIYLSAYQSDTNNCIISVKDERNEISKELCDSLNEIFSGDENSIRHKYGISRFTLRYVVNLSKLLTNSIGVISKYGKPVEYGFTIPIHFNTKKLSEMIEAHNDSENELVKDKKIKELVLDEQKIEEKPIEIVPKQRVEEFREPITVQVNVNTQSNSQQNIQEVPLKTEPQFQEVESQKITEAEVAISDELSFENLSCLYVEDQIDSQILFKVQMKGLKSIEFANSFEKAIPLLQNKKFDFIIMDINLQGEYNGLDALRAIQKMPEYDKVPIVAVTAYVLPGDRDRFITAGFNDFISKPILRDKLETVLNNIF